MATDDRSKFRIKVGKVARAVECTVRSMWLELCVLVSHSSMVSPEGPVVSLTSYGERVDTVHIAIESIARGAALPSRIILWLDHESAKRGLTRQLQRQVRRGLEIRTCHDFGPHKKYYPYLQSCNSITAPLVTADDDLLYPRWWLKRLIVEWKRYPDLMNCYRVRCIRFEGPELASYKEWELAKCTDPSFRHFAGSGAGIILPVSLQVSMKIAGAGFMDCCPRADDIWIHAQALRAGYMVRQIRTREFRLIEILRSQRQALFVDNLTGGGNDRQVAATYTARDLECLRTCNGQQRPNVPEKVPAPRHEIDYGYAGSD